MWWRARGRAAARPHLRLAPGPRRAPPPARPAHRPGPGGPADAHPRPDRRHCQRRHRPSTIRDPHAIPAPDLVERDFTAAEPDQLWVSDITQHLTDEGWAYCAVILDVYSRSRRVIGYSIAEHARTELITNALTMACQRRHPTPGRIVFHSDHGAHYTSWAFTTQLAAAGLHASMGTVGERYDNALAESFFATLQTELLDRRPWHHRHHLEQAIFEWIETWYNPRRRHSALDYHSPNDYEQAHTQAAPAA
ncbi:IS3 family transposase [Pseudonocardia yunnanensis]|uniref:IS3 family transposase n=1 Tax=Pseudonocardia yunnanensis TaxID=58107 RepID=A0ABW4F861_9PSEU